MAAGTISVWQCGAEVLGVIAVRKLWVSSEQLSSALAKVQQQAAFRGFRRTKEVVQGGDRIVALWSNTHKTNSLKLLFALKDAAPKRAKLHRIEYITKSRINCDQATMESVKRKVGL